MYIYDPLFCGIAARLILTRFLISPLRKALAAAQSELHDLRLAENAAIAADATASPSAETGGSSDEGSVVMYDSDVADEEDLAEAEADPSRREARCCTWPPPTSCRPQTLPRLLAPLLLRLLLLLLLLLDIMIVVMVLTVPVTPAPASATEPSSGDSVAAEQAAAVAAAVAARDGHRSPRLDSRLSFGLLSNPSSMLV